MAETTVKFVLEKITDVAVKEVLHLCGVGEQVEKLERELNWIKAFLTDADRKQITDDIQKEWVKEVREVAYCIEDVIDTFLCEIPLKKRGKREAIKRMFKKTKKLWVIRRLGHEMNKIIARIQEIYDKKVRFGINSLGEGSGGKRLPVRPPILLDIEDPDVIGLDADKANIIKELLDEDTPRRSVVSIIGQGGLGKTTLAKKVYNSDEIKRTFATRVWTTISQEFELVDVLRKIIETLRESIGDNELAGKDREYLLTELNQSLKEKKYLLIIDDIWTKDLMTILGRALPDEKNGSRILMTTRISEVAKDADPTRDPYELKFLTEESSLELFLKKALPHQEIRNKCPSDLLDLAKQFAKTCGGLPLALLVLGGLLGKKQPTYHAWFKVMQTMNWHSNEQKGCLEIISTSYDDLSLALKSCFMYFAVFPEDYDINAKPLLRMWIAEGFIPQEENRTFEDTAESFLEDLVQRSMIQVTSRSVHNDSIEMCRIHDLLLDVAIEKAKEDNFLTVCSTRDGDAVQSCGRARRVAVHNLNCNEVMKYASPNLRTLLCFYSGIPDCSRHRLIKVFGGNSKFHTSSGQAHMRWFQGLSRLKYLQLHLFKFHGNQRYFEKLIGGMKFLQTLDLTIGDLNELDLPDCLWHIKTLRFMEIYIIDNYLLGPPPITELRNLQSLIGVKSRESWDYTNLPNLPNLRYLGIEISEELQGGLAAAFLQTLNNLVSLDIKGEEIPIEIVDMKGFPFYQHLTSLSYDGRFACHDLDVTMFPTHLTELKLYYSNLQQGHMVILEKLQGLKSLYLYKAHENQTMRCSVGGFPRLQQLSFWHLGMLEEWEIMEGAMPVLKHLTIQDCSELEIPHGLQHLTTLTDLTWGLHGDNSGPSKEKIIRNICKHVPSISIEGIIEDTNDIQEDTDDSEV